MNQNYCDSIISKFLNYKGCYFQSDLENAVRYTMEQRDNLLQEVLFLRKQLLENEGNNS